MTLRARGGAPSLRARRTFAIFAAALRGLHAREDFRLVHYSVQTTHAHLVVEADGPAALGAAMRALSIRLTLRMNALLGTDGRFLSDRYHAHVLRTPSEVRHAVAYVLGNFASHARRRGEPVPDGFVDPCSSAAPIGLDGLPPAVSPPRTWLLASTLAREPEARYAAAGASLREGGPRRQAGPSHANRPPPVMILPRRPSLRGALAASPLRRAA